MQDNPRRTWELFPQALKTAVVVLLLALPIVALGRLMIATDEELDDVRAQALLEFKTETRTLTSMYQTHPDGNYSWGYANVDSGRGNLTYEAAVLKLDGRVTLDNLRMNALGMGYYNDGGLSPETNETYGWDVYLMTHTWGADGFPMTFNGLRLEYGRDFNGNFLFFRVGTDDLQGRMGLDRAESDLGAMLRISADAWIQAHTGLADANAYLQRHRQFFVFTGNYAGLKPLVNTDNVNFADFGRKDGIYNNGDFHGQGKTDFYISYADLIETVGPGGTPSGYTNAGQAFNAYRRNGTPTDYAAWKRIPGQGWWISSQRFYADANIDWN